MNIITALIVVIAGLLGAWYHWCEVSKRGDSDSFYHYLFTVNTGASQSAVVAFVAGMQTLFIAGAFDQVHIDVFIDALISGRIDSAMSAAIAVAFTGGYTADSKFNSSQQVSLRPDSATTTTGAD